MSGATFTWSNHKHCPTMSRLDRFLVSDDWVARYSKVCQLALPKPCSDHCPILLDSKCESWGPRPFGFELFWLENKQRSGGVWMWKGGKGTSFSSS